MPFMQTAEGAQKATQPTIWGSLPFYFITFHYHYWLPVPAEILNHIEHACMNCKGHSESPGPTFPWQTQPPADRAVILSTHQWKGTSRNSLGLWHTSLLVSPKTHRLFSNIWSLYQERKLKGIKAVPFCLAYNSFSPNSLRHLKCGGGNLWGNCPISYQGLYKELTGDIWP